MSASVCTPRVCKCMHTSFLVPTLCCGHHDIYIPRNNSIYTLICNILLYTLLVMQSNIRYPENYAVIPQTDLYTCRYTSGQRYRAHQDCFDVSNEGGRANTRNGGQVCVCVSVCNVCVCVCVSVCNVCVCGWMEVRFVLRCVTATLKLSMNMYGCVFCR